MCSASDVCKTQKPNQNGNLETGCAIDTIM